MVSNPLHGNFTLPLAITRFHAVGHVRLKLCVFNLHDGIAHIIGIAKNGLGLAARQEGEWGKE